MKRGFSLLEVVLAIGILGISLPLLWTHMAESANHSAKYTQTVSLQNTEKNIQNVLHAIHVALPLNGENCTYCGYKNDRFTITINPNELHDRIFMVKQEAQESIIRGSVKRITYGIYPWNKASQQPQLDNSHGVVDQFIMISSLNLETEKD